MRTTGKVSLALTIAGVLAGCPQSSEPFDDFPELDARPPVPDSAIADAGPDTAYRDPGYDASAQDTSVPDVSPPSDRLCAPPLAGNQPFRAPDACGAVLGESSYCAMIDYGQIRFVGLDTGTMCDGPVLRDVDLSGNASLAWAGGQLYACSGHGAGGPLVRISLDDGGATDVGGDCAAVTSYGGGLLVMPSAFSGASGLYGYSVESHAVDAMPDAFFDVSYFASRLGAHGDRALLAWHSAPEVMVADLVDGAPAAEARSIPLEGFDGWIDALDLLADGTIAIVTRDGDSEIVLFDPTGRRLRSVPIFVSMASGFACTSGDAPPPLAVGSATRPTTPPAPGLACDALDDYATTLDNAHAPSIDNSSCGHEGIPSNYVSSCSLLDPAADRELHVVGVYDGERTPGTGGGWECSGDSPDDCVYREPTALAGVEVTVRARPVPIVLVLSSYEAVEWSLTVEPGAVIDRVLMIDLSGGALESSIVGLADGIVVERETSGCGIAYGWEPEHNTGGGEYRRLIAWLRSRFGLIETTFQGCYAGARFTVPHR